MVERSPLADDLDDARASGTADVIAITRRREPVRATKLPGERPGVVEDAVARAIEEVRTASLVTLTADADPLTLLVGTARHEGRELARALDTWGNERVPVGEREEARREALAWCRDLTGTLRAGRVA